MSGWSFAQPHALWALLLLALLWWRSRAAGHGEAQWTAALALWRRAAQAAAPTDPRERDGLPPYALAAVLAALFGIFALAGPQRSSARAGPAHWTLVLDRSPAMFLPLQSGSDRPTRIERAVELAVAACERAGVAADAREWSTWTFDGVHVARGERPLAAWLVQDWGPGAAPPWEQLDEPDHVWVSDCEPKFAPLAAGRIQCGASAVAGIVADLGPRCLVWDGRGVSDQEWPAPRAGLWIEAGVAEDLAILARIWAAERALELVDESGAACLRLARAGSPSLEQPVSGKLVADRWSVPASVAGALAAGRSLTWAEFEDGQGRRSPAVQWRPGEVRTCVTALGAAQADPAVFALSWTALFDAARLPAAGVVSLLERARTGPLRIDPPKAAGQASRATVQSLAPWFAGMASALALLALALARSQRGLGQKLSVPVGVRVRSPSAVGLG